MGFGMGVECKVSDFTFLLFLFFPPLQLWSTFFYFFLWQWAARTVADLHRCRNCIVAAGFSRSNSYLTSDFNKSVSTDQFCIDTFWGLAGHTLRGLSRKYMSHSRLPIKSWRDVAAKLSWPRRSSETKLLIIPMDHLLSADLCFKSINPLETKSFDYVNSSLIPTYIATRGRVSLCVHNIRMVKKGLW